MARVHFVKKARKDNSAVKVGESYYWWSTRTTVGKRYVGQKHYSRTSPKRSQLTNSDFLGQMYDIEDDYIGGIIAGNEEELKSAVENAVEMIRALGEEQTDKLNNMPEQLQYAPSGEMLQNRADECESMASELEGIDLDDYDETNYDENVEEWIENKLGEIQGVCYNGE